MALLIDSIGRTKDSSVTAKEMKVKVSSIELSIDRAGLLVRLLEHYRHMVHFIEKTFVDKDDEVWLHFQSDLQLCDADWHELVSTSAVLQMLQEEMTKCYEFESGYVQFNSSARHDRSAPIVDETTTSDNVSIFHFSDAQVDMSTDQMELDENDNNKCEEASNSSKRAQSEESEAPNKRPKSESSTVAGDAESTTYPCPVKPCSVVLANQSHLRNHLRKVHPGMLTTCTMCNKTFDVRQTLLRHFQGVHRNLSDEEKLSLYIIPRDFEKYNLPPKEKFVRRQQTKRLLPFADDNMPLFDYRCQIAGCKFKTFKPEELAKHEQTSHGNQQLLDAHMQEAVDVPGYSCPVDDCDSHFDSLSHLKKHVRKHHSKEYTTCLRCKQTFSNRDTMCKHVRNFHKDLSDEERRALLLIPVADNGDWIDCEHHCALEGCDLNFETKDELNAHIRKHHADVYVTCCYCHKVSATVRQLKYHITYMHEEGEYCCPEEGCNFVGKYRKELKTHRFRNHKPRVTCKEAGCGETMIESNLTRHMLERHHVTKYQCTWPECDMSFMKQFHLKRHIRVHMNCKRFLCKWPECDYASEQKATVMTHVRVCHLKLPRTVREQREKNIEVDETQNPYHWIEVLPEDVIV